MAVVDRDKPLDATGLIQPEICAVNIPGSSFSSVELDAGKKLLLNYEFEDLVEAGGLWGQVKRKKKVAISSTVCQAIRVFFF